MVLLQLERDAERGTFSAFFSRVFEVEKGSFMRKPSFFGMVCLVIDLGKHSKTHGFDE